MGDVVCDFLFLAAWMVMAWAVHERLNRVLPLHGLPHYVGCAIEGLFDASTLLKLVRSRFGRS